MGQKTTYSYEVGTEKVDFMLRATIEALCADILNVAGVDAKVNGISADLLMQQNRSWVLSRMSVELDRQPEQYEKYDISTWVNPHASRLISPRNFELRDSQGCLFGRAVSQWCMIDFDTRMPADMNTMAQAHEGNMVDAPSPCERPRRLMAVDGEALLQHRVAYSDIDFNRHMNTMRYIDIIFDSMPIEVPEKMEALRMDINFMREARYGDNLSLHCEERDSVRNYEYRNAAGEALCRAALELK